MILTIIQFLGLFYVFKLFYFFLRTTTQSLICSFLSAIRPISFQKTYGKWAVVTGSTDGIGKAYAIQLAKRNMNLVLISRSMDKLKNCSAYIQNLYPVQIRLIQADFQDGKKIYEYIESELRDLDIGILVNNVGIAPSNPIFRTFDNTSENHIWNEIAINAGATAMMTRLVLPQMKMRRRGAVVNMGSMSSQMPHPYLSNYASTKAYMGHFSKCIQPELTEFGIHVQHLIPGLIDTNMTKNNCVTQATVPLRVRHLLYPNADVYASWAICSLGIFRETPGYWFFDIQKWMHKMQTEDIFTLTMTRVLKMSYGKQLVS